MAKITRAIQKIFCGDVPAIDNVAVFGSLAASNPDYSDDPIEIQSLAAYGQGWESATVLNQAPALQDMNALLYLFSRQIAYQFQMGIPEWIATETYYIGSFVNSSGVLYYSLTNGNINNLVTDTTKWQKFLAVNTTVKAVTAAYTILSTDSTLICAGSTSYAVTLPAVSGISGRQYQIKSNLALPYLVTVNVVSGGGLIDGQSTCVLSQYQAITVVTDGTGWFIV